MSLRNFFVNIKCFEKENSWIVILNNHHTVINACIYFASECSLHILSDRQSFSDSNLKTVFFFNKTKQKSTVIDKLTG